MSTPIISAGTTLALSAALPATTSKTGFEALTFTPIRGARSVGDIGVQYRTIERNVVGDRLSIPAREGYSSGVAQIELVRLADLGQDLLRAAVASDAGYSYRLTRRDGSRLYFTAIVTSYGHGGFAPNSIADTKITLGITSDLIET